MNNTQTIMRLRSLKLDDLKKLRSELNSELPKLKRIVDELESDFVKDMLDRARKHLRDIQESYFNIDCTAYPNVVVAKLSGTIGTEREVRDMLSLYENPIKRKKDLDEQIAMCDDVIIEKEKEVSTQRR